MTDLTERPTVHDLLARYRDAEALETLARDLKTETRQAITEQMDELERLTQVAPNLTVKGLAQAVRTQPSYAPVVDDYAGLAEFAERRGLRVRWTVDTSALQHDLDSEEVPLTFRAQLEDHGYLRAEAVMSEDLLAVLEGLPEDGLGNLIDDETGELLPVRRVAKSRAQVRITVSKASVQERIGELLDRGLLQIGGGR